MDGWKVAKIPGTQTHDWLLKKHYAKTVPIVSQASGLFDENNSMKGVCTFGPPPRMFNDGYGLFGDELKVKVFELNRLCVAEDVPENGLSWFVSRTLRSLPRPCAVVSYADTNWGHHGYIYQATNWLYCGTIDVNVQFADKETGKPVHRRTVVGRYGSSADTPALREHLDIIPQKTKHRYVYFVGSKRDKKRMRRALTYDVLPYPKGENERYETEKTLSERSSFSELFS